MPLQPRGGVTVDAAALVTENLVDELRRSDAFHRVTSWAEVQGLLSMEQTKQLVNCDDSNCVAEIMGVLNVDYVVQGSLGRLGRHWIVNLQLLHVRSSTATASVSLRVCGDEEEGLLASILPATSSMLYEAGLARRRPVPLAKRYQDCAAPVVATDSPDAAAAAETGPGKRIAAGVVGGGAFAVGALLGLASLVGGGFTVYLASNLLNADQLRRISTPGLENEARLGLLWGGVAAVGAPALLCAVAGLVLGGVGITALVLAVVLGG